MRFLRRRQPEPPESEPAASVDETGRAELHPTAVFRLHGIIEGKVQLPDARLSDWLNAGQPLHVLVADVEGNERWELLHPDDVIALAVPPHPLPSRKRVALRRCVLELKAPPYTISGTAHLPHGADPSRYAGSASQRWLAMTQAVVGAASEDFEVDVVLVNLDHVLRH